VGTLVAGAVLVGAAAPAVAAAVAELAATDMQSASTPIGRRRRRPVVPILVVSRSTMTFRAYPDAGSGEPGAVGASSPAATGQARRFVVEGSGQLQAGSYEQEGL
jgi:hypothetical protein